MLSAAGGPIANCFGKVFGRCNEIKPPRGEGTSAGRNPNPLDNLTSEAFRAVGIVVPTRFFAVLRCSLIPEEVLGRSPETCRDLAHEPFVHRVLSNVP